MLFDGVGHNCLEQPTPPGKMGKPKGGGLSHVSRERSKPVCDMSLVSAKFNMSSNGSVFLPHFSVLHIASKGHLGVVAAARR